MVTKVTLRKEKCIKQTGDLIVCEIDAQMNPLGEIAQAIWNKAGENLVKYRRNRVALPLQEGSIVTSPSFNLDSRFNEIVHIVMPIFDNPSTLTSEDREKLKNCYDTIFSKTAEMMKKKIVLRFLGKDRNERKDEICTSETVNIAFSSVFEATGGALMTHVNEILFATSIGEVYDFARANKLYKDRKKKPENKAPNASPCNIGETEGLLQRVAKCEGKHLSLIAIIGSKENGVSDLFGCVHEADLIMSRIGKFDVDWTSKEAADYEICEHHLNVFLRDWKNPFWKNFKSRDGNYLCSFPDHQGVPPALNRDRTNFVNKEDCIKWMQDKGVLLKVGSPICQEDANILRGTDFVQADEEEYTPRTNTPTTPRTPISSSKAVEKAAKSFLTAVNGAGNVGRKKDFSILSDRQQREKVRLVKNSLHAMCEVVAPDAKDDLLGRIVNGEKIKPVESCAPIKKLLTDAADLYERTDSKLHRLFILSSVAQFPLPLLQQYFHGLTDYYHKKARDLVVRGTVEDVKRHILVRYDETKLDKLIEFILSPLVALNLPFDERQEKMDDGSKMPMPNIQRLQTIDEVYRMYLIWLEQEGIPELALKETTAKYIIKLVAPTRRKNLTCVDEKIADGMKAFDELFSSVSELMKAGFIDKQSAENLTKHLQSGKAYLRGDFKVHVQIESNCADHCATFALSDKDSPVCFADKCKHAHNVACQRCDELEATLTLIHNLLDEAETDSSDAQREKFNILKEECAINRESIKEMKNHQIRAALSHIEKTEYVNSLTPGQAIVTLDWAQKLTPFYAREKQVEYYAKSGIAYHMSHAETVLDGKPAEHLSVHILKPGEKQDGTAVYLIIESFLIELKKMGINRVLLRSDCAGCYRNASLICSLYRLQKKIGMKIDGLLFSEAQAGKGPCDRGSARVKGKARDHVTSTRGKVESSGEFFKAVTTGKLLNGVSIHQSTISNAKNGTSKILNISSYSSFEFEKDGIRMRRHRSIGKGLLFDHSDMAQCCSGQLTTVCSGGHTVDSPDLFWLTSATHRTRSMESTMPVKEESSSGMLRCWEEGCIKEYRSFHQLERHLFSGKHEYQLERKTMHDYCIEMASLSLISNATTTPFIETFVYDAVHDSPSNLPQGWALRKAKARNNNDQPARELIRQFFAEKRKHGKVNPHEAEIYMKKARGIDGKLIVSPSNRLSITQIKSLIRGLLKKEEEPSTSVKKKKPPTTPNDSIDGSSDEDSDHEEKFSDDSDDEEFVRALINDHRDEIFEKDENPAGRKRKTVGK